MISEIWVGGYNIGNYYLKIREGHPSLSVRRRKTDGGTDVTIVARFSPLRVINPLTRRPELGVFIPNLNHWRSEAAASLHRFACEMPVRDRCESILFLKYAKEFILRAWRDKDTVRDHDIPNFRVFLEKYSNYPGPRKRALQELRDGLFTAKTHGRNDIAASKGFMKFEIYDEPKAPRAINSYSDTSKVLLAGICHAVDKKTFATKWFVKGSNPKTWPLRLEELFGGEPVVGTDFTSFEAHHSGIFAQAIRFWWLHMVRNVTGAKHVKDLVSYMMGARNECSFRHTHVSVDERLMSGALWTSSANGMLNLLLSSYISSRSKNKTTDVNVLVEWSLNDFRGLVEGDDGLCLDVGQDPTIADRLGLKLKWERAQDYSSAGFCGIVCTRGSTGVLKNPISVLRKFFVLEKNTAQFRETKQMALVRAKALSYKYTFGKCPVIGAMCDWVLRMTKSFQVDIKAVRDVYERELLIEAIQNCAWKEKTEVDMDSRILVHTRFGLPVETQLAYENAFSQCNGKVLELDLGMCTTITDQYHERIFHYSDLNNIPIAPILDAARIDLDRVNSILSRKPIISKQIKTAQMTHQEHDLLPPVSVNDHDIPVF